MKKFLLTAAIVFGVLVNASFSQASHTFQDGTDVTDSPEFHRAARQLIVGVVDPKTPIEKPWTYKPISLDPNKDLTKGIDHAFNHSLNDEAKATVILRTLRHCLLEGTYVQDAAGQPFKMTQGASDFHKLIEAQLPTIFKSEDEKALLGRWCAAVQLSFSAAPMAFVGEMQEKSLEKEILKKFPPSSPRAEESFWGQIKHTLQKVTDFDPSLTPKTQTSTSSSTSSKADTSFLKDLGGDAFEAKLTKEVYPLAKSLKLETVTLKNQIFGPTSEALSKLDATQQKEYKEELHSIQVLFLDNVVVRDENVLNDSKYIPSFTLALGKDCPNLQALAFIQGNLGCPGKETLRKIHDGNPNLKYLMLMNLEEAYWKKLRQEAGDNKDGFIQEAFFCKEGHSLYLTFKDRS